MADTLRTLSALQTLFADNTTQQIGAQDYRDFIVSTIGYAYGRALSANTSLDTDDIVIAGTGGAGGITLTLPAVATSQYKTYHVVKVDAGVGTVVLDGNGAETINGAATYTLTSQYDAVTIWCDGTEWFVLGTK
jgi:hypothetical protein